MKLRTFQDGKSNYLEGAMLLGMYTIIALAFVSLSSLYPFFECPELLLITTSMYTPMR